jgi:hypothetical protein
MSVFFKRDKKFIQIIEVAGDLANKKEIYGILEIIWINDISGSQLICFLFFMVFKCIDIPC